MSAASRASSGSAPGWSTNRRGASFAFAACRVLLK
jgi:hypothetical protein